ncbi:MAG: C13 family peptidase [Tahibacter sp.]
MNGGHVRVLLIALLAMTAGIAIGMRWRTVTDVAAPSAAAPVDGAGPAAPASTDEPDESGAATADSEPDFSAEVVMYDQPRLMQEAIAAVKPGVVGKTDLYLLAFAGDGAENVFRNEVEYAEQLFSRRFSAKGHTLILENNPATVASRPLASWSNLETALDAIATKMDPEEDVLLLFMTTHGDQDHVLYVGMDPLPLDQISAEDLAQMLATRPFRWKVIVVSACYSGGFIDPLRNATSMVISASRADRASFGCGADADITWFGKAFLAEGLNQSDSFRGAFEIARRLIGEWETREKEEPSEPQISTTPLIESKLADWRNGLRLGPPVPFAPAVVTEPPAP